MEYETNITLTSLNNMTPEFLLNLDICTLCSEKVVHQTHGDDFVNWQFGSGFKQFFHCSKEN